MRLRSTKGGNKHNFDPYGIYGSRSASRVLTARRRREQQSIGLILIAVVAVGISLATKYWPRAANLAASRNVTLVLPPAALPVVADSNSAESVLVPTEAGRLLAIDIRTGSSRIVLESDFPLRVQPLADGERAFLPAEDGTLFAINWQSGKLLWRATVGNSTSTRPCFIKASVQLPPIVATPPTVATAPPIAAASVVATAPTVTPSPTAPALAASGTPIPPAAIQEELIVAGSDDGTVAAFQATDGRQVWKQNLPGGAGAGIIALPDVQHPAVLVPALGHSATSGGLWCLDANTGSVLWRFPKAEDSAAPQLAPPAVGQSADGVPLTYALDDSGAIFCVDARSGHKIWKTYARPAAGSPPNRAVMFRTEPLLMPVAGAVHVYAGGNDGALRCLDAFNGNLLWTKPFDSPLRRAPIAMTVATGTERRQYVLVNTRTDLEMLDAQTGSPVYTMETGGPAFCAGIDAAGHILAVSDGGDFETFELPR